jgi:uncharacterized protein (DUF433 family)
MSLVIVRDRAPLETDPDGVVRIGGTRVTLDTVISAFNDGATAEEIVYRYPTLQLADVYAVISYYLRRKKQMDTYLQKRKNTAEKVRKQNMVSFDAKGLRERLLARQGKFF